MIRRFAQFFIAGVFVLAVAACANYQIGSVKPSAYEGIENLHVPPFKNDTLEPRLSSLVTNAVLKELQADGTYRVATKSNSDAVLKGRIVKIHKRQLRAVRTDTLQSQELQLFIHVEFYFEDPNTGHRINSTARALKEADKGKTRADQDADIIGVREGRVIGETIQFVDDSYQVGERNALAVAAEDLADKLVSQIANGW